MRSMLCYAVALLLTSYWSPVLADHSDSELALYALLSLPDGYQLVNVNNVEREVVSKFYRVKITVKGDDQQLECNVNLLAKTDNDMTVLSSKCE